MTASSDRRDEGFVSTFVAGLIPLLLLLCMAVAAATAVGVARHAAEVAADVAALAAAQHALEGERAACAAAQRITDEQHVDLVSCRLEGLDAVVRVGLRPPGRLSALGPVHGSARAGRR